MSSLTLSFPSSGARYCLLYSSLPSSSQATPLPPIRSQLLKISASSLAEKIVQGEVTSHQVVSTFIQRIKEVNPIINAMVDARFAEALAEAEAIDTELEGLDADERRERCRRQPFLGVPFSTKVMTLGVPISTKVNHLFPGLLPSDRPLLDSWFARQVFISPRSWS